MDIQAALRALDLGNSVAEFDQHLDRYFVVTSSFLSVVNDRADIVAGEKGAGKTALYRSLTGSYASTPELRRQNVEIIPGFNPRGPSIFHNLVNESVLHEMQYIAMWKTYILALVGNWLLQLADSNHSVEVGRLYRLLSQAGLLSNENGTPASVFTRLLSWMHNRLRVKRLAVQWSADITGAPIVMPFLEFDEAAAGDQTHDVRLLSPDEGLAILDAALAAIDFQVWVAIDRLDEAFIGYPDVEIPVLRALLRTYLDFTAFDRCRLKLFVRNDLFRRITADGFVNLTHVNARKIEIIWDKEDLLTLLCRRIRENQAFLRTTQLQEASNEALRDALFGRTIEGGGHRLDTWAWILAHIRDGNSAHPPRNLIDLVNLAREEQERRELRSPRVYASGMPLMEVDSLKQAVKRLGERRLEDTLQAEGGKEVTALIIAFQRGKAIHNEQSLSTLWHVDRSVVPRFVQVLRDVGFLEQVDNYYKVPALYQAGLQMTSGRAF